MMSLLGFASRLCLLGFGDAAFDGLLFARAQAAEGLPGGSLVVEAQGAFKTRQGFGQ